MDSPPTWGMNWDEDIGAGEYPNAYFFYLPRLCNHCSRPACVEACPEGALYKRKTDGLVLRDEDRCKGEQACARACPYKKIYFNAARRVSQHCIGCFPRLEKGVAPACVRQCPGRAAFFGFLDDPKATVRRLVREWEIALPLHAEWGTEPNVFYIRVSPFAINQASDPKPDETHAHSRWQPTPVDRAVRIDIERAEDTTP